MTREQLEAWAGRILGDSGVLQGIRFRAWNPDRAEDALQHALARAVAVLDCGQLGSITTYEEFAGWIVTTARNAAVSGSRRRHPQQLFEDDDHADNSEEMQRVEEEAEERANQRKAIIQEVLAELPEEERELLAQRVHVGCVYDELAEATGCSTSTAWRRWRELRAKVRQTLLDKAPELFFWMNPPRKTPKRGRRKKSSPTPEGTSPGG